MDKNKDITGITYNYLNLPEQVNLANGDYVKYSYDAAGAKLRKEARTGENTTTTDYVGGIQYANGTLDFLQHAEGRYLFTTSAYQYHLTDHLGNVRVTVDATGAVVQRDDYYPFGGTFNSSAGSPKNNYLYNGKELQEETEWYDYGARMQDPWLGRFFTQDRFAEKYYDLSPYQYGRNNPLLFIDVNGDSTVYYDNNGNQLWVSHDGLDNGVTFIDDDNVLDFYEQLGKDLENDQSSDLRGFGTTYLTDGIESFFEDNKSDTKGDNGNQNINANDGNPLVNEHGSFLYQNKNGEVEIGSENIPGTPGFAHGIDKLKEGTVGSVHTHPNAGRKSGSAYFGSGVGSFDHGLEAKERYYNVAISSTSIIFFNNKKEIKVNRATLFRK
ncbi:MAG: RHS repeat-associated core domain-containing protein [Cyclobacteriaceae bacterium]|nr:RHS repeat-associated core domain-containing protein [Cyclobacteriaceae bacterium]